MDRDHSYNKEDLAKYTIKDSVFTSLFSDKKYIVQLYEALHPEAANVTEDDITSVTLENILMAGQFNDLGFNVNDRLIITEEFPKYDYLREESALAGFTESPEFDGAQETE